MPQRRDDNKRQSAVPIGWLACFGRGTRREQRRDRQAHRAPPAAPFPGTPSSIAAAGTFRDSPQRFATKWNPPKSLQLLFAFYYLLTNSLYVSFEMSRFRLYPCGHSAESPCLESRKTEICVMPPGRPTRAEPEASQSRTAKGGAGRFAGWRGPGRVAKPRTQTGAGAAPPECAASGPPAGESMDAQTLRPDTTETQKGPNRRPGRIRPVRAGNGRKRRGMSVANQPRGARGAKSRRPWRGCTREADETRGWTQRAPPPRPVPRAPTSWEPEDARRRRKRWT